VLSLSVAPLVKKSTSNGPDRSGIAPTSCSLLFAFGQAGSLGPVPGESEEEVRRMARPRWQRLTITIVKSAVTLVVLWAVGRHVLRTWNDLRDHSLAFKFEPGWLIGSGLLYLAGLTACGRFYERVLRASPTPVRLVPTLRAYLVSHLGKYVPGKAMVVVVRAAMVVPFGARASTAAIATFYETLVMMASGGLIAAAGFGAASGTNRVGFAVPQWGQVELPLYRLAAVCGLGCGLAFLMLVVPPVFGRLAVLVSLPIPGMGPGAMPRFTGRLLGEGLLWSSGGWVFLGLSQLAVVRAFDPARMGVSMAVSLAPAVIASVALATVAGFVVAVLPGGLGVREGVLMSTLAPAIGTDQAVIASLLLRLVWVAAELVAAAILVPWFRTPPSAITTVSQSGPDRQ
jgi:glycosyltransferase 2 family protein